VPDFFPPAALHAYGVYMTYKTMAHVTVKFGLVFAPSQTKHSTQNYTNNKGHTTYSEQNANTVNKYYN
jgi:hypothetical protein